MTILLKPSLISMLLTLDECTITEPLTGQSFDFSSLKYIGGILAVLLFLLMIYLLIKIIKIVFRLEDSNEKLKSDLARLESEKQRDFNQINKKINDLLNKNSNPAINPPQSFVKEEPSEPITFEIKKEAIQPELEQNAKFYFSTPYLDNKFLISDGKITPNEKTFYCISNDTLMLYENINSEAMNSAINSMDLVIKTACQVINSKEPNHSVIRMVQPGKVIKEAEDYKILEKVKVKFQ